MVRGPEGKPRPLTGEAPLSQDHGQGAGRALGGRASASEAQRRVHFRGAAPPGPPSAVRCGGISGPHTASHVIVSGDASPFVGAPWASAMEHACSNDSRSLIVIWFLYCHKYFAFTKQSDCYVEIITSGTEICLGRQADHGARHTVEPRVASDGRPRGRGLPATPGAARAAVRAKPAPVPADKLCAASVSLWDCAT